jgi:hypothetical protein
MYVAHAFCRPMKLDEWLLKLLLPQRVVGVWRSQAYTKHRLDTPHRSEKICSIYEGLHYCCYDRNV